MKCKPKKGEEQEEIKRGDKEGKNEKCLSRKSWSLALNLPYLTFTFKIHKKRVKRLKGEGKKRNQEENIAQKQKKAWNKMVVEFYQWILIIFERRQHLFCNIFMQIATNIFIMNDIFGKYCFIQKFI